MAERREKGLCFYCDQKFSTGHHCKGCFLLVEEGDNEPPGEDLGQLLESPDDSAMDLLQHIKAQPAQLTLNALSGVQAAETLRVMCRIDQHQVYILVDGGSTHNFIQPKLARELGLVLSPTSLLKVLVGSGEDLRCSHVCTTVRLEIQGHIFTVDLFVLDMRGSIIVLGTQ